MSQNCNVHSKFFHSDDTPLLNKIVQNSPKYIICKNRSNNVYLKIRSYNTIGFKSGEGYKNEPKKNKNGGRQNLDVSWSSQFGSHLGGSSSDEKDQNCDQRFDAKHGDGKSQTADRNLERLSLGCPVAGGNCPGK
jgi:hypothetical protein